MATTSVPLTKPTAPTLVRTRSESQWAIVLRRFRKHRMAMISLGVLLLIFLASLMAPILAPFPRDAVGLAPRFSPPLTVHNGQMHWLGTDHVGRDFFTRLLYAARITLSVSFFAATFATLIGMTLGALAGYFRGVVDSVVMRIVEFMASIPDFPILLIIAAILASRPESLPIPGFVLNAMGALMLLSPVGNERAQVVVIIVVLTTFGWISAARLMRGMVLSVRERDFIEATRALGASNARIILRHVVPNAFPPLVVSYTLSLAGALTAETALSFLGIGITDPTPTWGNMLQFATNFMLVNPWVPLIPGLPVVLASLAFNFIGDGLRDALDPRLKM
ncbi:MAG: ABC transporter permease [Thermoflexales bacterium]|nr:ABC transporter permease [Thermoflexales bacterium]